jgi:hypothetical protein
MVSHSHSLMFFIPDPSCSCVTCSKLFNSMLRVLYSTVQYCVVLYSAVHVLTKYVLTENLTLKLYTILKLCSIKRVTEILSITETYVFPL